ncbi:hypothetical protein M413DRAFT_438780 [Hebeloma cylindrosporum]|uniref:Uncharacterized protein n=1 Tax=Hebeloma cylindrosporum TaxID=76867 RepID=A0A0C2YIN7_HEBCY|nr:hypothetical protein M413DRAFT_438780 [Hebeloma cylindrosporum h7]
MSHSNSSNTLDDVYFDFNYFISSALEDASFRVNKLSSLHDWVRAPAGSQVLKELQDANVLYHLLSRATGVFQTIASLLLRIGMRALLVLIAILVGVPLWLLSASLASFFSTNPIIAVASCAALGMGFFATIRALSNERDILIAFRDKANELWPTYEYYKYANREEYLAGIGTPEGAEKKRRVDELHDRAKSDFVDILVAVTANRADKVPGFENISEVQLREHLRQAIHETNPLSDPGRLS